ncbi:MAG: hypothetical protein ACAI25_02930, partial [Planctomycetota bacterium]
ERAIGAGGMLACFLVGGAAGDAVRVWNESAALLGASAGTTAGALALIGANASIQIRTREKNFVAAIVGGLFSALLTTLFSGAVQHGAAFTRVLPAMLPAAGTSFLVGGFLAGLVPLYDPAKKRHFRGALLVASLAALVWGLATYGTEVWPLVKPSPHPRPVSVDEPELELHWDPRLEKYAFGVPITHRISPSPRDIGVVLAPNYGSTPVVWIRTSPRGQLQAADTQALELALMVRRSSPDAKPIEEGPVPDCPLGPAYRHVVRAIYEDQSAEDYHFCVIQGPDDFILVEVRASPERVAEAKALGTAIARSLKVHAPPSDKKDGGNKK